MEYNNFYFLSYYFDLLSYNEFLFISIIQRKKDGNDIPSKNSDYRTIKIFTISSYNELLAYKDKIVSLCKKLNARAYVNLEKRNYNEIALHCASECINLVQNNCANNILKVVQSCCAKYRATKADKYYVLDIDVTDTGVLQQAINLVEECKGNILTILDTVNGHHVVCSVFNREKYYQLLHMKNLDFIEVKSNSPVLLYYNKL